MAFSGNLKDLNLSEIFSLLGQQGKSGTLMIKRGSQRAILEIQKGKITDISVGKRTPESVVRDVLVYTGRAEEKIFAELRAAAYKNQKNFSQILVEKNFLTEEEKNSWFKIAMEDMVFELFNWKTGEYVFESLRPLNASKSEELDLDLDFVILEGMRRQDEWLRLNKKFPSKSAVFKVIEADYADYDLGEAAHVIEKLDGKKSIEDLSRELPFGFFRLYFHLAELWNQEFIAPAQQGRNMSQLLKRSQSNVMAKNTSGWAMSLLICAAIITAALAFRWKVSSNFYISRSPLFEVNREQKIISVERALVDYLAGGNPLPSDLSELKNKGYSLPHLNSRDFQFIIQKSFQSFKLENHP